MGDMSGPTNRQARLRSRLACEAALVVAMDYCGPSKLTTEPAQRCREPVDPAGSGARPTDERREVLAGTRDCERPRFGSSAAAQALADRKPLYRLEHAESEAPWRRPISSRQERLRLLQTDTESRRPLVWRVRWTALPGQLLAHPTRPRDELTAGRAFLQIPGMVITLHATQTPIPEEWKIELARYLANVQRNGDKDDQGWGL